ncbi:unnamed protein product [Arabis nemorensis]|uniref:C2H2-type domain-containing protein n=1 Tax=Arabis nemorensis TaxID=586526 RepID=A0A565C0Q8_9BRAS|nr:unnamed protein product [Arabis nemorensis]
MECERSSSSTSSETGTIQHHRRTSTSSSVSTVTRRMYECTFCKRGFTNAQALGGHMNIHRRDRLNKAKLQNEAGDVALSGDRRCFHVAVSDPRGYELVDSVMLRTTTSNLSLRIGSMATRRENVVVEGDEIDLELRLGF